MLSTYEKRGMAENTLVSIITPVRNGIKFLELCIQSVLNQSYPNIEHIFVDGGSTDGTLAMLASYQAKYPARIRFVSEPDSGPEDAWNKGLIMAKGEIFGWLGADDTYEPDAIQTIVEFFKRNPEAYFVFGGYRIIDEMEQVRDEPKLRDFNLNKAINDSCDIPAHSAFYKREVVEKVGLINTTSRISEFDYWMRVAMVFRIYRLGKILSNFRVHKDSFSGSLEAARAYYRDSFRISRRYGGSLFSPRARRYLVYRFGILARAPVLKRICPKPLWN